MLKLRFLVTFIVVTTALYTLGMEYDEDMDRVHNDDSIASVRSCIDDVSSKDKFVTREFMEEACNAEDITELQSDTYKKNAYADIIEIKYTQNSIKIIYPQFIKDDSMPNCDKVNDLLRSEALSIIDTYDEDRLDDLFLEVEYEIVLKTDDIISIKFFGYGDVKETAHPNRHFYTLNVDLHEAKKFYLEDFINTEDLAAVIKDKNMSFDMKENESSLYTYYVNQWLNFERLSHCDRADSEMYSYLTKTSLGISFPMPHALGDYKKVEIDYVDIREAVLGRSTYSTVS